MITILWLLLVFNPDTRQMEPYALYVSETSCHSAIAASKYRGMDDETMTRCVPEIIQ